MLKAFAALGSFLILCSCAAEPTTIDGIPGAQDEEATGQARDELTADLSKVIDLMTPEERAASIRTSLSAWKVYLTGKDHFFTTAYHERGRKHFWADPAHADREAQIIVMREGDAYHWDAWIYLDLKDSWMSGDAYLRELMRAHHLSPLDVLGILSALQQAGDEPPSLASLYPPKTLDCYECGPGGPSSWPPLPLPGGDHTGPSAGWPGSGGQAPPGLPGPPPGASKGGGGFNPGDRSTWGPIVPGRGGSPWKPDPKAEERRNGVGEGDPDPTPAPTDAGYHPSLDEKRETFKCEGGVFLGYKRGCIDFQETSFARKWATKLGGFVQRNADSFQRYVFHTVWHDGKNPQCMDTCADIANLGCYGIAGALVVICVGLTDGACLAGVPSVVAGFGVGGLSAAQCTKEIGKHCGANICIR